MKSILQRSEWIVFMSAAIYSKRQKSNTRHWVSRSHSKKETNQQTDFNAFFFLYTMCIIYHFRFT